MEENSLGENLKKIRKRENLSQEETAEKLGISRRAYSDWERGLTSITIDKAEKFARVTSSSVDEVLRRPSEAVQLKALETSYGKKFRVLTDDYERQLNALRQENAALKDLVASLKQTNETQKSMIAMLQKESRDLKGEQRK